MTIDCCELADRSGFWHAYNCPVSNHERWHTHDGQPHMHTCQYLDQHTHPEHDVPASPGNEPAEFGT